MVKEKSRAILTLYEVASLLSAASSLIWALYQCEVTEERDLCMIYWAE